LEASVKEEADKLVQNAIEYAEYEKGSLETAAKNIPLVKAISDQLKSGQ
jgi:hypothetical protein